MPCYDACQICCSNSNMRCLIGTLGLFKNMQKKSQTKNKHNPSRGGKCQYPPWNEQLAPKNQWLEDEFPFGSLGLFSEALASRFQTILLNSCRIRWFIQPQDIPWCFHQPGRQSLRPTHDRCGTHVASHHGGDDGTCCASEAARKW